MPELKQTPLADVHRALGAKMVAYAGFEMPVQYPTGILAEHQLVRAGAGLFDISHMGEFEVTGPDRNAFLNRVTCNDISVLEPGGVQYSGILTPEGTFVDDCTLYRFDNKLMVVVNAANTAAAWKHFVDHKGGANIRLKDISDEVGLLALQGPNAAALLQPLTAVNLAESSITALCLVRWPGSTASSPAPATPAKTASSSIAATGASASSGPPLLRPGRRRSAWAHATRFGSKWVTRSTATRSTARSRPSRPGSVGS
jgi:hypothetical protein